MIRWLLHHPSTAAIAALLIVVFEFESQAALVSDPAVADGRPMYPLAVAYGIQAAAIERGELWRFLTAPFLHSGPDHITLNLIALLYAGSLAEPRLGAARFSAVYLAGLIGGGLLAYVAIRGTDTIEVGASGAIIGLFGAMLVRAVSRDTERALLWPALIPLAVTFGAGAFVPNVSTAGHAGGVVAGGAAGAILQRLK